MSKKRTEYQQFVSNFASENNERKWGKGEFMIAAAQAWRGAGHLPKPKSSCVGKVKGDCKLPCGWAEGKKRKYCHTKSVCASKAGPNLPRRPAPAVQTIQDERKAMLAQIQHSDRPSYDINMCDELEEGFKEACLREKRRLQKQEQQRQEKLRQLGGLGVPDDVYEVVSQTSSGELSNEAKAKIIGMSGVIAEHGGIQSAEEGFEDDKWILSLTFSDGKSFHVISLSDEPDAPDEPYDTEPFMDQGGGKKAKHLKPSQFTKFKNKVWNKLSDKFGSDDS
jgi:hypothetical protein